MRRSRSTSVQSRSFLEMKPRTGNGTGASRAGAATRTLEAVVAPRHPLRRAAPGPGAARCGRRSPRARGAADELGIATCSQPLPPRSGGNESVAMSRRTAGSGHIRARRSRRRARGSARPIRSRARRAHAAWPIRERTAGSASGGHGPGQSSRRGRLVARPSTPCSCEPSQPGQPRRHDLGSPSGRNSSNTVQRRPVERRRVRWMLAIDVEGGDADVRVAASADGMSGVARRRPANVMPRTRLRGLLGSATFRSLADQDRVIVRVAQRADRLMASTSWIARHATAHEGAREHRDDRGRDRAASRHWRRSRRDGNASRPRPIRSPARGSAGTPSGRTQSPRLA